MADEVELFDCIPQLKGGDGSDLGLASISLRRAATTDAAKAVYLHMVTDQSGSVLSDLALVDGSSSNKVEDDGREQFGGAFKALTVGDASEWKYSSQLERTLTLNEATAPVQIKFSNQSEVTFFSMTVAAATAALKATNSNNYLVAQSLVAGRSFDDDAESLDGPSKEITLNALSLSVFDNTTLEMLKSNSYSSDHPTARVTTEWMKSDASAQFPYLKSLFIKEGAEVLIAASGEVLSGHWACLENLAGNEGTSASKIYVIGARVVSVDDAAEAVAKRLKSRLQNTGARMSVNVSAEAVRARSSSLRRSLPPQQGEGTPRKDTSLADEISKARASMKHVDESPSAAPLAPPPAAPKPAAGPKKMPNRPAPPKRGGADDDDEDAEVSTLSANTKKKEKPTSPNARVPDNNAAFGEEDEVRVSPLTAMHFGGEGRSNADLTRNPSNLTGVSQLTNSMVGDDVSNPVAIVGDDAAPAVAPKQKKSKKNKAAVAAAEEDAEAQPALPQQDEAAAATADALYSPSEREGEEAASPAEEGEEAEAEVELTQEEVVRLANKLKKRKTKIEVAEERVADMEAEVLRRSELMATEQSELADERQRLEQLRITLERQHSQQIQIQQQLTTQQTSSAVMSNSASNTASSLNDHATINMRDISKSRGGKNSRLRSENQPLLAMGHGDADQYVFRVEHEFYDSKDMPPGMLRRMPFTCGYIKYTALNKIFAMLLLVGIAGAMGLLSWRIADNEAFVWPMLVAFALCGVIIGAHSLKVGDFYDLYHAVDQSMHGNSGNADPHANGYEWSPLTLSLIVFTALCSFGCVGLIAFDNVSIEARVGFAAGGALCCLGMGSILVNLSLVTHVLWYRIASTVPRQHGSLFTRVSIRAAAARYQYAKQLVELGSRRFSPTVLMIAASTLAGAAFAPYYMFIISNTHQGHLAGAIGYTVATAFLFVLVLLLSSWEGATRQVIGNMGVQADRWVRGDYNNESDAKLEDYISVQQLLVNNLLSGEYAKWTIDFVPFLKEGRSDVVPADFRNVVIGWPYRLVSFLLLVLGIVIIPVVASGRVEEL